MGRSANMSPLGLFNWDNSLFDLMVIPTALDKETLVNNLLAETAELEVLYPNPVVFKNLLGVWSHKQLDIWNRLYDTTQYEYNPIENYNRYETGSTDGTGSTTHAGTDSTTDKTTYGGTNSRNETITDGGKETENITGNLTQSGSDEVSLTDTKGHWIAGFDSTPSGEDDGLVKQTRDQDDGTTTTTYGKIEDTTGTKTTNFGKTEQVNENTTYGQTITNNGSMTHGEEVRTTQGGSHNLHAHGNIGVMSTQDMIKQEREIDLFNLYDIIIEDFKMRFCILVY